MKIKLTARLAALALSSVVSAGANAQQTFTGVILEWAYANDPEAPISAECELDGTVFETVMYPVDRCNLPPLAANAPFTARVRACGGVFGCSAWSEPLDFSAVGPNAPGKPALTR